MGKSECGMRNGKEWGSRNRKEFGSWNAEGGIEKNWEWGSGNDLKAEVGKWNVEEWKDK